MTACTFDPTNKSSSITLSNGDLTASLSGGGWVSVKGTQAKSAGIVSYSVVITGGSSNYFFIGLGDSASSLATFAGNSANSLGCDTNGGPMAYFTAAGGTTKTGVDSDFTVVAGDTLTLEWNAGTGTVVLYKNGISKGTKFTGVLGSTRAYFPEVSLFGNVTVTADFTNWVDAPSQAAFTTGGSGSAAFIANSPAVAEGGGSGSAAFISPSFTEFTAGGNGGGEFASQPPSEFSTGGSAGGAIIAIAYAVMDGGGNGGGEFVSQPPSIFNTGGNAGGNAIAPSYTVANGGGNGGGAAVPQESIVAPMVMFSVEFELGYGLPAELVFPLPMFSVEIDRDAMKDRTLFVPMLLPGLEIDAGALSVRGITQDISIPLPMPEPYLLPDIIIPMVMPAPYFAEPAAVAMDAAYCYHLDREGIPVTRFTGFNFLRIVRVKGQNIGYTRTGRYLIGGPSDNGARIAASFTLASHSYETLFMKRCPWLHYHGDHGMRVTVRVGGEDGTVHGPYLGQERRPNQGRAQIGGGISAGLWSFKIENIAGQPLKIGWLEPDFIVLSRRV